MTDVINDFIGNLLMREAITFSQFHRAETLLREFGQYLTSIELNKDESLRCAFETASIYFDRNQTIIYHYGVDDCAPHRKEIFHDIDIDFSSFVLGLNQTCHA